MNFDPFLWFMLSDLDAEEEQENERESYDNHWSDNDDENKSDAENDDW
ncbi:MAG: hypothetical protein SPL58_05490 [Bacteroidaceae bacterium]|nr:hypothetical protein [Bacteroidaceae bacterium]